MYYKGEFTALLFEGYSCSIHLFKTDVIETVTGSLSSVTVPLFYLLR
jgi:hypothetical protein